MYVLFDDILQRPANKNAIPAVFTQPQARFLSTYTNAVGLAAFGNVNCIGLAGFKSDATYFRIRLNNSAGLTYEIPYMENGLYLLPNTAYAMAFQWLTPSGASAPAKFGRIGMGMARRISTAVSKPLAYHSSLTPEFDGAGAAVVPRGNFRYRTLSLECRYPFTKTDMEDIQAAYLHGGLGDGMPLFFDLTDEAYKLPLSKLYALDQNIDNFAFANERGRVSGADPVHFSHTFDLRECL